MPVRTGTYQCLVCNEVWDSSEVANDFHGHLSCGNQFCGANVRRVSPKPKAEYLKEKEKPSDKK